MTVFTGEQRITGLINELGRFAPAEAVMNAAAYDNAELAAALDIPYDEVQPYIANRMQTCAKV